MEYVDKILKALKKRKESVILDLYIKDYDKSNFYFAIVYNEKIKKFKVLFVPIDGVDNVKNIEEYFCYQFIFVETVNYIMECINTFQKNNKYDLDCRNKDISSYYIEINTNVGGVNNKYLFTRYIDKNYVVFFDIIVTLFEHAPNIVSELCKKLLGEFDSSFDSFKYNGSFDIDISDYKALFSKDVLNTKLDVSDIEFIETVGNYTYGVIGGKLIVLELIERLNILNVFSGELDVLGEEVYTILSGMLQGIKKPFYRLELVLKSEDFKSDNRYSKYYLCYGVEEDHFKIVDSYLNYELGLENVLEKLVKTNDYDNNMIDGIKEYLNSLDKDIDVDKLVNFFIK